MSSFEVLSDDPILHICSYLRGRDLLNLSEMNTMLNRTIKESKETMKKIRLVLQNHSRAHLNDVIATATSRQFIALKLTSIYAIEEYPVDYHLLLRWLGLSVEDLIIEDATFEKNQFREVIRKFLRKLKTCTLDKVYIRYNETTDKVGTYSIGNITRPLEALKLMKTDNKILRFFASCTLLGELTTSFRGELDGVTIARFLKLPHLKKLNMEISGSLPRYLMKAICNAPQLEDLQILVHWGCQVDPYEEEDPPQPLVNYTVKKLKLEDKANIAEKFFKMFRHVESVNLKLFDHSDTLDLTDVPLPALHSLKLDSLWCIVKFSPINVPKNVKSFESAVTSFVSKSTRSIIGITVGHRNWSNYENFRLSNAFCEEIVKRTSKLRHLKLYNVADTGSFKSFLNVQWYNYSYDSSNDFRKVLIVEPNEH